MRIATPAVMILLVVGACTFARYAERNQLRYDGTLERARALGHAELIADLEALGAAKDYNAATLDVLQCLGNYTDGLQGRREYEIDGELSAETVRTTIQARSTLPEHALKAKVVSALDGLRNVWSSPMRNCQEHCTKVIEKRSVDTPSARDIGLASKYFERCEAEYVASKAMIDGGIAGDAIARAEEALEAARTRSKAGCFVAVDFQLRQAAFELRDLSDEQSAPVHAKIAEQRRTFARGLERVERYNADTRVRALADEERALQTEIELLETQGASARDGKQRVRIGNRRVQLESRLEKLQRRRRAMVTNFGIPCATPF